MTSPGQSDAVAEPLAPHERASATPVVRVPPARHERARTVLPALAVSSTAPLRAQQRWFVSAIMTPESEAAPAGADDAARILTEGPHLSALERLEVYRRGYHARLIECLADDYPALRAALGDDAFDGVCRAYVDRHPSMGPNLNSFGRAMAEFCEREMLALAHPAFAADLARLEWAIVEVIHARSADPLLPEGLLSVPVERWADARLVPTPAFRLLQFRYPINAYFQSFRDGATPDVPALADSMALVYRSGPTVWRMSLTVPMFELLSAIAAGGTLGESVERAAAVFTDVAEDVAAARMMVWFRDWVASGLFAGVDFG